MSHQLFSLSVEIDPVTGMFRIHALHGQAVLWKKHYAPSYTRENAEEAAEQKVSQK